MENWPMALFRNVEHRPSLGIHAWPVGVGGSKDRWSLEFRVRLVYVVKTRTAGKQNQKKENLRNKTEQQQKRMWSKVWTTEVCGWKHSGRVTWPDSSHDTWGKALPALLKDVAKPAGCTPLVAQSFRLPREKAASTVVKHGDLQGLLFFFRAPS